MTIIKIERDEAFTGLASIDNLRATVPEALRAAAVEASEMLRAAGIRHVLVGGVAVSCNGYGRTTQNVDVGVEQKAFEYRDKAMFLRIGLPFKILGIPIHYIAPHDPFEVAMLEKYALWKMALCRALDFSFSWMARVRFLAMLWARCWVLR